ncbi:sensor histidine kinase [Flaviflexus equikiangi]|uniref:Sensor-like histidine kinase SenX3 n=1 Tax=Flaviflexus equikiangi TaxID=2758573 RepID=A0ABS2TCN2_9ACTO|nr:ATP-binding protein [Flaviflexus equikiangi]MBM9432387.1 two-component sensor histidine kinase [Flaviflexus equikiangi]
MPDIGIPHLLLAIIGGILTGWILASTRLRSLRSQEDIDMMSSELADRDVQSLLAAIPQAHILLTRMGDVEKASTEAYSFGIVRGSRIIRSEIVAAVQEVAKTGDVKDLELSLRRSFSGTARVVLSVRVAPMSGERTLVLFFDTTEAKRLEETRRDFVANISHELKTPIGAIGLLSETIQDCADEPEHVVTFAEKLQRESARLASLVQDIIELSRVQNGAALASSELVDVDDIVSEAIDRCRIEAESRGLTIVAVPTPQVSVVGDRALLTTAIRNLIDNAIRYSNPGGRVSIGVSRHEGEVRIAVVDQGAGIPDEQKDRVFERFYRGDDARTRDKGGSGLGLSIVKHVAADHGGRVMLWSEAGKGSTFTFIVPDVTPAVQNIEEEEAHE